MSIKDNIVFKKKELLYFVFRDFYLDLVIA